MLAHSSYSQFTESSISSSMAHRHQTPITFFLITLFLSTHYATANDGATSPPDLIHSSCVQASFPNLCIRTLSSYSGAVKTPQDLAQATITVSLSLARSVSHYLAQDSSLRHQRADKGQRVALNDCVEQMSDSVDELSNTLGVLQHLRREDRRAFQWQMSNAETWVSAALTNEDSCLDGFKEVDGEVKLDVKRKISKVARVTSNALYMINRLEESLGRKKIVAP